GSRSIRRSSRVAGGARPAGKLPVVDFHAYFQPPRFLAHLRGRKDYPRIEAAGGGEAVFTAPGAGRPIRPEQLDLDRRVELMDEAGVDTQVLRLQNVGGIDSFPVEEARHAVLELGHRGVGVSCHLDGVGLDDPTFADFLHGVQALDVPLLVLPNHPPLLQAALDPYGWLAGAFGFQVDLTWAVLRLLASGVAEREVPRLTVIVANLGGVLGGITERLDQY